MTTHFFATAGLEASGQRSRLVTTMLETLRRLAEDLLNGSPVAYCRLVETRGSTPQKAGATMLIYPDGSQFGTLGGGCVEAEVRRRAIVSMVHGRAEIAMFSLDSDYGWDDGLICGGRMQILIDPLNEESSSYYRRLIELAESPHGVTEAVVFDSDRSGLNTPSSFLFDGQGQPRASLRSADGSIPPILTQRLKALASRPGPYVDKGISFLPLLPRCRLLIVGGGHVGKAVADLAVDLEFDVWVVDDRGEFTSEDRFPRVQRRISGPLAQVLPGLEITSNTYCLIVTRGHNHDEEALCLLAERGARYVGLIGSRRKIRLIFEDLLAQGISAESLQCVFAPVGIDIGSQTVNEIAISIVAELVAHRNCDGVVPGRPMQVRDFAEAPDITH
jgi:xanthine dehydrogenase accessory factor